MVSIAAVTIWARRALSMKVRSGSSADVPGRMTKKLAH
jgi:hypothetical protein